VGNERTFVGLDVHARSVTGHALDAVTGEVWQRKLCPDPGEVLRWVSGLPVPNSGLTDGVGGDRGWGQRGDCRVTSAMPGSWPGMTGFARGSGG
jgi:hypothetical protein